MDVNDLKALNVEGLEAFADRWAGIHRKLKQARTDFRDDVVSALRKDHWIGEGGKAAQSYCERVLRQIDALDAEVRGLRSFIDTTADGSAGRKGVKGLEGHQKAVVEYCRQASEKGMTVGAKGDVSWSEFRAPGPVGPVEKMRLDKKDQDAKDLERKIKKELAEATEIDQQLARDLKVIFGTPENFETESRRFGTEAPTAHDLMVELQLRGVAGVMDKAKNWDHASSLLSHYLDGSGRPYTVDPKTMLNEIPSFRTSVNGRLDDVRAGPNGRFDTGWKMGQASNKESLDWYYALHHFEYRVVGEKKDGEITYHVEVRKRYDWGIPSEHRRNLEGAGGTVDIEQADVAHLNASGMGRDFDVRGRTPTTTAPG